VQVRRKKVLMVGEVLANLNKAIDLLAPEVLSMSMREALDINGGRIFGRLLRGLLFLFERSLRGVIVVFNIIRVVNKIVVFV
jgi:hypothetical protein